MESYKVITRVTAYRLYCILILEICQYRSCPYSKGMWDDTKEWISEGEAMRSSLEPVHYIVWNKKMKHLPSFKNVVVYVISQQTTLALYIILSKTCNMLFLKRWVHIFLWQNKLANHTSVNENTYFYYTEKNYHWGKQSNIVEFMYILNV